MLGRHGAAGTHCDSKPQFLLGEDFFRVRLFANRE